MASQVTKGRRFPVASKQIFIFFLFFKGIQRLNACVHMHFYSGLTILGSKISNSNNMLSSVYLLLIKLVKVIIGGK